MNAAPELPPEAPTETPTKRRPARAGCFSVAALLAGLGCSIVVTLFLVSLLTAPRGDADWAVLSLMVIGTVPLYLGSVLLTLAFCALARLFREHCDEILLAALFLALWPLLYFLFAGL